MYLESLAIGVGYTWDSVQGTKKIVGKRDLHGKPVYLVKVGSRTGADFIPVDEIEQEVHLDTSRAKSRAKATATATATAVMDKAQKSWDGFTDSMPAHRRARAHAALSKQVRHKGEFLTRGALVKLAISQGYKIAKEGSFGDVLRSPSGSFLSSKELTKTGLDFARFLA